MLTEIARKTILAIGRTLAFDPRLDEDDALDSYSRTPATLERAEEDKANLVSSYIGLDSKTQKPMHAPAIDIDFPCYTIPSSTPGHSHLYFDKPITWEQYKQLLNVLVEIGYVEKGYRDASFTRRASYLRLPGVLKKQKTK